MATKKAPREVSRRLREEQARQAAETAARRRRQWLCVAAAIVVIVAAAVAITLGTRSGGNSGTTASGNAAPPAVAAAAAAGRTTPAPWDAPADQVDAIKAAGLSPLTAEGTAEHYHAHLDVIVNGTKVPVPADIGIDVKAQRISVLHTHDTSGVLHIESPTKGNAYYLGQLFREWDVALTADQIGGMHTDATHTFTAYIDGKPVSGNPAGIKLAAHQEIALVYAAKGQHVDIPNSYEFGDL